MVGAMDEEQAIAYSGYVRVGFSMNARKAERFCAVQGCVVSVSKSDKHSNCEKEGVVVKVKNGNSKKCEIVLEMAEKGSEWVLIAPRENFEDWLTNLQQAVDLRFEKHYKMGSAIGEGAFATVHICYTRATSKIAAVKLVSKAKADVVKLKTIRREVMVHRIASGHPNVVQLLDVFEDNEMLYVVMEYMMKDLFDMQTDMVTFKESQARSIIFEVLQALHYCHMNNVVHRDIKPENLFCSKEKWPASVKIADFGLSRCWDPDGDEPMTSFVGTNEYVAPEVSLELPYGFGCDIWSTGVVLFELLSGRKPFNGDTEAELLRAVQAGELPLGSSRWSCMSSEVKSLLKSMVQVDQNKRLSAQGALLHSWFTMEIEGVKGPMASKNAVPHVRTMKSRLRICVTMFQFVYRLQLIKVAKKGGTSLNASSENMREMLKRAPGRLRMDSLGMFSPRSGSSKADAFSDGPGSPSADFASFKSFENNSGDFNTMDRGSRRSGNTSNSPSLVKFGRKLMTDNNQSSTNNEEVPVKKTESIKQSKEGLPPVGAGAATGESSGRKGPKEGSFRARLSFLRTSESGTFGSRRSSASGKKMLPTREKSKRRPINRFPSLVNLSSALDDTTNGDSKQL
uniref:Protein kinase domain-containing protein n=1 Tax=Timspurckia oligopyrenoides TaxID=708627 RepID=A0A7S0ZCV6_9RHOD|mmetsp:Transcript_12809/g.23032  ORF Transcript_12809/g.23032 Transcript_12809/m.23032 type:complete len:624 (+) Transcript_12809:205-2076(+)